MFNPPAICYENHDFGVASVLWRVASFEKGGGNSS
jgi:hypothetical protein